MAGADVIAYAAAQPPELEKLVLVDVAGLARCATKSKRSISRPRTPRAFEQLLEASRQVREAPPTLELEKIAVPTLILAGRHSLVMGADAAQRAARRLRQGRVVISEHSAHALAREEAEKFQNVVAEFVERAPQTTSSC